MALRLLALVALLAIACSDEDTPVDASQPDAADASSDTIPPDVPSTPDGHVTDVPEDSADAPTDGGGDGCTDCADVTAPCEGDVRIDVATDVVMTSRLHHGVTWTQHTLPPGRVVDTTLADEVLRVQEYVAFHVRDFGPADPMPTAASPINFRWHDREMARVQSLNPSAKIILNAWGVPEWMRGGSTEREPAPAPEFVDDFANLVATFIQRYNVDDVDGLYPDIVAVQYTHEFKGYFATDTWDNARATRDFNTIRSAVLAVDAGIEFWGPYLVLEGSHGTSLLGHERRWYTADRLTPRNAETLEYFFDNVDGIDGVAIDMKSWMEADTNTFSFADVLRLLPTWRDTLDSLQDLDGFPPGSPIIESEDYAVSFGDAEQYTADEQAVALALMWTYELLGGVSLSLRWGPEQASDDANRMAFYTTSTVAGGEIYPAFEVQRLFAEHFGEGVEILGHTSAGEAGVVALASAEHLLLINTSSERQTVDSGRLCEEVEGLSVRVFER